MSQKEESSIWLLSVLAALNLAAQCNPDSFVINTANVLEWQAGHSARFLDLGLFDFHLSHSHKARCVDNTGQGEDFKANSSPRGSVGSPQKGAVPLVRPISGSSAVWWEKWGRGSGEERNETPSWFFESPLKYPGKICMQQHLLFPQTVSPCEEAAKKHWVHRKPSSWLYIDKQSSRICHGKSERKAMHFNCFSRPLSLWQFSPKINNVDQWFTRSQALALKLEVLQGTAEGAGGLSLEIKEAPEGLYCSLQLEGACSVVGVGLPTR